MKSKENGLLPVEKMVKLNPEQIEKVGRLLDKIKGEVPFVGSKPYSHNIIGICLLEISTMVDKEYANQVIEDFHLDRLGWRKEAVE